MRIEILLVDAELEEVIKGQRGMIQGIEACLERQCLVSALTLIYAAIDSISALTREIGHSDTNKTVFRDWVNEYMVPQQTLNCTADDIYGARCGILHTYSPESRIQRDNNGRVKRLIYRWKAGPAADAQRPLPPDSTVLIVEDVFNSFTTAVDRFLEDVKGNSELAVKVESHCGELLCYEPFEVITVQVAN